MFRYVKAQMHSQLFECVILAHRGPWNTHTGQRWCLSHEGSGFPQGKGGVLDTKTLETQGKDSVFD